MVAATVDLLVYVMQSRKAKHVQIYFARPAQGRWKDSEVAVNDVHLALCSCCFHRRTCIRLNYIMHDCTSKCD